MVRSSRSAAEAPGGEPRARRTAPRAPPGRDSDDEPSAGGSDRNADEARPDEAARSDPPADNGIDTPARVRYKAVEDDAPGHHGGCGPLTGQWGKNAFARLAHCIKHCQPRLEQTPASERGPAEAAGWEVLEQAFNDRELTFGPDAELRRIVGRKCPNPDNVTLKRPATILRKKLSEWAPHIDIVSTSSYAVILQRLQEYSDVAGGDPKAAKTVSYGTIYGLMLLKKHSLIDLLRDLLGEECGNRATQVSRAAPAAPAAVQRSAQKRPARVLDVTDGASGDEEDTETAAVAAAAAIKKARDNFFEQGTTILRSIADHMARSNDKDDETAAALSKEKIKLEEYKMKADVAAQQAQFCMSIATGTEAGNTLNVFATQRLLAYMSAPGFLKCPVMGEKN